MIGFDGLTDALRRVVVVATMAMASVGVHAAPGSLDTTFGAGNGVILTSAGNGFATGIALAGDGKIFRGVLTNYSIANAFRYRDDGSLDTTFNGTGRSVDVPLSSVAGGGFTQYNARASAVQADGKVLVMLAGERPIAGSGLTQETAALILRFNTDGTIDSAFGTNGVAVVEPSESAESRFYGLALQPDGKILLAGRCPTAPCAVRLLANGGRDTGFGVNGIANHSGAATFESVRSITTLPDGRILMGGGCSPVGAGNSGLCAWRFAANGATDTTFAAAGLARITVPGTTGAWGGQVVVAPDGSVLIAGNCPTATTSVICMARLTAAGYLDTTFNVDGTTTTLSSGYDLGGTSVALQGDGRIQIAVTCTPTGTNNLAICLYRYNNDGYLDSSYGGFGRVISNFSTGAGAADSPHNIALQPDGKLLVGAACYNTALGIRPCIARYESGPMPNRACSMDIDGDGKVTGTVDSLIHARIAMGITGSAVIGGITFPTAATRKTWPAVRDFLVMQCGMSLLP